MSQSDSPSISYPILDGVGDFLGGEEVGRSGAGSPDEGEVEVAQPTDISIVPDVFASEAEDEPLDQSAIMMAIIGANRKYEENEREFNDMPVGKVRLSTLRDIWEKKNEENALRLLDTRRKIDIDKELTLEANSGQFMMYTSKSMIDYHLTVANSVGFSSILPNAESSHTFEFEMDLKKPYRDFKGKHAMLGFDPTGRMLYVGRCKNEDVYLAMVPDAFLNGEEVLDEVGEGSKGSSVMCRRHYRQVVMMLAHFLADIPGCAFHNAEGVYQQDLDSEEPNFRRTTNVMVSDRIRLNFEAVKELDKLISNGYDAWVDAAPPRWRADKFLQLSSPILVTSRYGQDARIAIPGCEAEEAAAWQNDRDYSKIAFLTVAIATSIECKEIQRWNPIPLETLKGKHSGPFYDGTDPNTRREILLEDTALTTEEGLEFKIYDSRGARIPRRKPVVSKTAPLCGVLMDLEDIQDLFNPNMQPSIDNPEDSHSVPVYAYPLAFLRTAGNIQADGIPHCFYPELTAINKRVRKNHPAHPRRLHAEDISMDVDDEEDDELVEEDRHDGEDSDSMPVDFDAFETTPSAFQAVKPISSQFYNLSTHRVAPRAGAHDSQQGTVTAAIAGAFAKTAKDRLTASDLQIYCNQMFPSDRFLDKISKEGCPTACRAEFVYSIDVRALKKRSGEEIFNNIIIPLTRSWTNPSIRSFMANFFVVFKPRVFPALYKWVSYPMTCLMKAIYQKSITDILDKKDPCPFRLELLAAIERVLCFCHTGSTAVFATSVMSTLCISRSAVADGFPMLWKVFNQPNVTFATRFGLTVDPHKWPMKDGYPAIASKRAQVLTYSLSHFMAYQAKFRIDIASSSVPVKMYNQATSPVSNTALAICNVAFDAFFDDTKQLVADGVRKDIKRRFQSLASSDRVDHVAAHSKLRESCLQSWLKQRFPLGYGEGTGCETYSYLIRAVAAEPIAIGRGLGNWDNNAIAPSDFVDSLFNMSREKKPAQATAPVLQTGSFLPVLKVAHAKLLSLAPDKSTSARESFVKLSFSLALKEFDVRFFPYTLPRSPSSGSGSPHRKPLFNSWAYLGARDSPPKHPLDRSSKPVPPETVAYNNAIASDCNARWNASKITMKTLKNYLNKTSLPADFAHISSDDKYVDDTYRWVQLNYDGTKPKHHLALIISIIVASTFLPDLFIPARLSHRDLKALFKAAHTTFKVRELYNSLGWESRPRRGMSDRSIFIAMITSFIIALYEEQSPLRKHMSSNQRGGLGEPWTQKNTPKAITYQLLIRIGILWGKDAGAYEKGMFGSQWGLLDDKDINDMYSNLIRTLTKKTPSGDSRMIPFDCFTILVGEKGATHFCTRHNFSCRPPIKTSNSTASSQSTLVDHMFVDDQ